MGRPPSIPRPGETPPPNRVRNEQVMKVDVLRTIPLFPASVAADRSFNGLCRKSKFLTVRSYKNPSPRSPLLLWIDLIPVHVPEEVAGKGVHLA